MPRTSYPLVPDLQAFLGDAGIVPGEALDLSAALDGAVEAFERDTGFTPFLAQSTHTTRRFDPPSGRLLELRGGLIVLQSVTIEGQAYEERRDFKLMPSFAPLENAPYTQVFFHAPVRCESEGIEITGLWGYAVLLPELAFKTVLQIAALSLLPQIGSARVLAAESEVAGQEKARQSGSVRVEYTTTATKDISDLETLRAQWESTSRASTRKFQNLF